VRPLLRPDQEIEVLGLHLTIKMIVGLSTLACVLVIVAYAIGGYGGENGDVPPIDNTTGRYQEESPNWTVCGAFIFLGVVIMALILIEIGN
jgi:hypothetical protein